MKYLGITGASGLIGGRFLGKIIFGTTAERRESILNHGWLGWARIKEKAEKLRAMLGQAKLALCFQIPSQASLNGILKPHRSFGYANGPALQRFLGKKQGCDWSAKRGDVVKKQPQVGLRVSFQQQIQHSRSESTPRFLSSYRCKSW